MFSKLNRIFKNRLTRNIFIYYFGSQILVTAVLLGVIFTRLSASLESDLKQVVHSKLEEIEAQYHKGGLTEIEHPREGTFLQILGANQQILYRSFPKEDGQYEDEVLKKAGGDLNQAQWFEIQKRDDEDKLLMISELIAPGVRLQVGVSTENSNDQLEQMVALFTTIFVPFLLISFCFALFTAGKVTGQLDEVMKTLNRLISGQFHERARVDKTDLKDVVILFNRMMDQLELLITKNRHELDHFAHDVKTPITRFKLIAEKALINREDPNLALWALEEASDAAEEITVMISSLFDISLTESGAKRLNRAPVKLGSILAEVTEVYELVATEKNIRFEIDQIEDPPVFVDRLQIKRVMSNLIDNAVKYGAENSEITVSILKENSSVKVIITNRGIGIAPGELSLIWGRFYRGENTKEQTKGYGLGLSFAKAMIELHGGSLSVESIESVSASFIVLLPISNS